MKTFELLEAKDTRPRLTITPTRVTLKLSKELMHEKERYIKFANAANEMCQYDYSLRGAIKPLTDSENLRCSLVSGSKNKCFKLIESQPKDKIIFFHEFLEMRNSNNR